MQYTYTVMMPKQSSTSQPSYNPG